MMAAEMLSRRKFLALSSQALPGAALRSAARMPLGVQLYTVRQLAEKDLPNVLRQIHAIGYEEVETYWNLYLHAASALRGMIESAGLRISSGHFPYEEFPGWTPYARRLGVRWMVCAILPDAQRSSAEAFQRAADQFNRWGKLCQAHGMRFAFHNHNYEFRDFHGDTGYDILLRETDPDLVFLEMDAYWIAQAGRDPVILLRQLGKRVRLLHLKDRRPNVPTSQDLNKAAEHFTEVGRGAIDWRGLLATARRLGVEHYYVEQDVSANPLQSLKISYDYLRRIAL